MSQYKEGTSPQEAEGEMSATEAVNTIEKVTGRHEGYRRLHARGGVYQGTFTASGQVSHLTTARYLNDRVTPILVRFSNGAGNPAEQDIKAGVRGMAVRFLVDGHADTDLVAASTPAFPSHNAEGFIELISLLAEVGSGKYGPQQVKEKLGAYMQCYPESVTLFQRLDKSRPPASAATTRYNGLHAYFLVDDKAVLHPYRYRLIPDLGEIDLTPEEAAEQDAHFWLPEINQRLLAGPIGFKLVFQLAEPGDLTNDPSSVWPEDRQLIVAGHLEITAPAPDAGKLEREVFDPTRIPSGIQLSDDPVLLFRTLAYAVSAERRLHGE